MFSKFFLKGYNKIRVEGFRLNQFLSDCLNDSVELKHIHKIDDFTMDCTLSQKKLNKIMKKKRNKKYRITILKTGGLPNYGKKARYKKGFILGFFIFISLLYYQSLFITEIEIKGNETIKESALRSSLAEIGIIEGNKKNYDLDEIKKCLYKEYEDIAWLGMKYSGNKVTVEVVEKRKPPEIIAYDIPCDIVARKKGYVEKVITKYGTPLVKKGDFINKGDILISSMVIEESGDIRYVHSLGEVHAKIIYRLIITEEKKKKKKSETGKQQYGVNLRIGDTNINSGTLFLSFDHYRRKESEIFKSFTPFPIELCLIKYEDLDVTVRERQKKEIEESIMVKVKELIEKNIPEDAEIANKDLMFSQEKNIIKVRVMIEAIEQIGQEVRTIPLY
ncbi:MAG: sporulation protein YqfD [Clostridia bacterium]|nr:sporulation protein YqfD [Clostridia bacterium]